VLLVWQDVGAMQSRPRSRQYRTRAEKAKIVAAYKRSGLSQREFSLQHGIAPSNIQRWVGQFAASAKAAHPAALVEVPNLLATQARAGAYRLQFAQGLQLEVTGGFEIGEVRALAQLLQSL
jgi:transposase-like protein